MSQIPYNAAFHEALSKYTLPRLGLLKWSPKQTGTIDDEKRLQTTGQIIVDTLGKFGIEAQVLAIVPGPTVTLYEIMPGAGVPAIRIANRKDDIRLALAAGSIRIVSSIPGRSAIGIEVPNPNPQVVKVRELLVFEKFTLGSFMLPVALGKDVMGKPVIADIRQMPHVLIAGASGTGKSVCISSFLITLLHRLNPGELRLILIDPRRTKLSMFSEIPHLLCPPLIDATSAMRAFKWLRIEMESRHRVLSDSGSMNLKVHNGKQAILGRPLIPYIVVVVDELADLMISAPKETEDAITRLAQMSRPLGIHLVLATQRPGADVITELIKANMPTRIAFQVASQFDSRTILGGKGAESLLGRGDMLYLAPDASMPVRLQGAHVDEEEIHRVVDIVRSRMNPVYVDFSSISDNLTSGVDADPSRSSDESAEEIDPQLYEAARRFIIQIGEGSTSKLQKKFKIGFNRALRIIEMLEKEGILGPNKGTRPRDVLPDKSNLEPNLNELREVDSQLYEQAKEFIIELKKAWTWQLENKFRITRKQAEAIVEMLKLDGIFGRDGPARGT